MFTDRRLSQLSMSREASGRVHHIPKRWTPAHFLSIEGLDHQGVQETRLRSRADQEMDDRPLQQIRRLLEGQHLLEDAKQTAKAVTLGPARDLEEREPSAHLRIALERYGRVALINGGDVDLEIVS